MGRRLQFLLNFTPRVGTTSFNKAKNITQWRLDTACNLPESEGNSKEFIAEGKKTSFAQLICGRNCPDLECRPKSVAQAEGLEIQAGVLNSRFKNSLKWHATFYVFLLIEIWGRALVKWVNDAIKVSSLLINLAQDFIQKQQCPPL